MNLADIEGKQGIYIYEMLTNKRYESLGVV